METSSEHLHCQTVRARELKFWEKVHLPPSVMCHVSCVMCHVSSVICHPSSVTCHMSDPRYNKNKKKSDKVVKLGGFLLLSKKLSQDFLRTFWGFSEDFMWTCWGLSEDFLRTLRWTSDENTANTANTENIANTANTVKTANTAYSANWANSNKKSFLNY